MSKKNKHKSQHGVSNFDGNNVDDIAAIYYYDGSSFSQAYLTTSIDTTASVNISTVIAVTSSAPEQFVRCVILEKNQVWK